jgi:hypothetical protein
MTFQFTIGRRDLAWALALVVLLTSVWVARGDMVSAGGPPPGTGIARVYVTVGTNYADALGVGPGAGANGAAIILLPTDPPIPADTEAELVRLDPRSVVIVGGTGVISVSMEAALVSLLPNAAITRIAGSNRYATNAEFSEQTFPIEGWISIPPWAFTVDDPDTEDFHVGFRAYSATTGVLTAPVNLPHGAEILELKAVVFDNADHDLTVSLSNLSIDSTATIINVSTSGYNFGHQTLSSTSLTFPAYAIVNNENFSYRVTVTGAFSNSFGASYVIDVKIRYRLGVSTG